LKLGVGNVVRAGSPRLLFADSRGHALENVAEIPERSLQMGGGEPAPERLSLADRRSRWREQGRRAFLLSRFDELSAAQARDLETYKQLREMEMLSHRHARAGYQWDPNAGEFGEFVESAVEVEQHHQIAATPAAAAAPGAEHAEASHGQAAVAEEVLRSLDESLDELNFDDLNASLESSTSLLPLRLTRSLSPADKAMAQLLGSAFWDPEAPTAAGVGGGALFLLLRGRGLPWSGDCSCPA
jgi:hypothetical protein